MDFPYTRKEIAQNPASTPVSASDVLRREDHARRLEKAQKYFLQSTRHETDVDLSVEAFFQS